MIHQIRLGGCIAAVCLAAIAAAAPATASARSCTPPDYPGSGYFTSLKVSHVSCRSGRTVTLAHYRCRTESGRAGRCKRLVRGYRCSERRTVIPTEINSRVTCKKGVRRVIYTYQQNT
jgi:hypothetical protein